MSTSLPINPENLHRASSPLRDDLRRLSQDAAPLTTEPSRRRDTETSCAPDSNQLIQDLHVERLPYAPDASNLNHVATTTVTSLGLDVQACIRTQAEGSETVAMVAVGKVTAQAVNFHFIIITRCAFLSVGWVQKHLLQLRFACFGGRGRKSLFATAHKLWSVKNQDL